METIELGVAALEYDNTGKLIAAKFIPASQVNIPVSPIFKDLISGATASENQETTLENARFALSSWFNKLNEVELADMEKYEIAIGGTTCHAHENGVISNAYITFVFRERNAAAMPAV